MNTEIEVIIDDTEKRNRNKIGLRECDNFIRDRSKVDEN